MYNDKTFLTVLCARGDSKGVPRKNVRTMLGRPMLFYSLNAAMNSQAIDKIILSTDSEGIAEIVRSCGVAVDYMRPPELATDESLVADAMVHVLDWVKDNDKQYDYVQLLQPTSPLITHDDIDEAIGLMMQLSADMVVSVCPNPSPYCNTLGPGFAMTNFIPDNMHDKQRQDLDAMYYLNSYIYIGKWGIFAERKNYYKQNTVAYIMSPEKSVDVDTELDFKIAEFLLKERGVHAPKSVPIYL